MEEIRILDNGESDVQIATVGVVVGSDHEGNPVEQNFTEDALKSIAEKQGETEILVDADHESELGGTTEAKGWLSSLKFIPGTGLFGKIKWTDIGRKLIENRVFRWLSPAWMLNENAEPEVMTSVALTNRPSQLGRVKPVINSSPKTEKENLMEKEETNEACNEQAAETVEVKEEVKEDLGMTREDLLKMIDESVQKALAELENFKETKEEVKEEIKEEEPKEDSEGKKLVDALVAELQPKVEEPKEEAKEEIKEEEIKEEVKNDEPKEVIKKECLNSAPSAQVCIATSKDQDWKNLHGKDFFEWLKKNGNLYK